MNPSKKILLLGATGRTGKEILLQALDKDYHINVLVRDNNKIIFSGPNLNVFVGDTRSKEDLINALSDCEAVISCLNISRNSDFPWSALRTPKDFLSLTMKNLIEVCKEKEVRRLVFTSAWGVGDSRPFTPTWFRWFIDHSNLSPAYMEHERQELLIRDSGLDYTIVRPVGLINSQKIKPVKVIFNNQEKPSFTISRKSTAKFILESLGDQKFFNTAPVICS